MVNPGVSIVGCGLIGQKRALALGEAKLVSCVDIDVERAQSIAALTPGCRAESDWQAAVSCEDVHVVVVATTHDALPGITAAAIGAGCHVLVEKPAACHAEDLYPLIQMAQEKQVQVRVGFNHRYHRAFQKARQIVDAGDLGRLMFLRGRYGHGGRLGYEKEWRAQPSLSGGGELIDQGVHLIDLARWFLGEFVEIEGFAHTYFWDMPVDDNAFLLLRTDGAQTAFLHASCTEWKNTFSFEIYGEHGKLQIDGIGGSYGTERLTWYRMLPQMGPPETTAWEFPMADNSWEIEMKEFLHDIKKKRKPDPGLEDAVATLDIVEKIYKSSGYDHCT